LTSSKGLPRGLVYPVILVAVREIRPIVDAGG